MAGADNLKPFGPDNPPPGKGRPKGSKNRSTVLKKWLTAELDINNPITKERQRGTVEDAIMLALLNKARNGDIPAIKEVLDTMYGKLTDKLELTGADLDAAVERELARLAGGGEVPVSTEAQE